MELLRCGFAAFGKQDRVSIVCVDCQLAGHRLCRRHLKISWLYLIKILEQYVKKKNLEDCPFHQRQYCVKLPMPQSLLWHFPMTPSFHRADTENAASKHY